MATFALYQPQQLAFDEQNDFTLFPYQDSWNAPSHSYIPPTTYQDHSYLQATAFDTYAHQQQYAQAVFDQCSLQSTQYSLKGGLQPPEQAYSPSNSAAHSFDLQNPPVLSSTSDSGASVQSTVSSGTNSPSVLPQQSHDWSRQVVVPSIVPHDSLGQDLFATTSFDFETLPVTDKGCVGELANISSSQYLTSSPELFSSLAFSVPEAHGTCSDPTAPSGVPPSQQSTARSRSAFPSPYDSVFRSPSTPASLTSPTLERVKGRPRTAAPATSQKHACQTSPLSTSISYETSDPLTRPKAPVRSTTTPFFTQSSGHFVPPLDFSCPYSPRLSFAISSVKLQATKSSSS